VPPRKRIRAGMSSAGWPGRSRREPPLLAGGVAKISQKVGEEAVEIVVAANSEDDERLASEAADLLYHLLVLLQARGVPLDAVWKELERREKRED
jgi:phosphoribosyl-ATP pyrophosphohydrolase